MSRRAGRLSRRALLGGTVALPSAVLCAVALPPLSTPAVGQEQAVDVVVLNTLLAVEHAAIYDLAVIGSRLDRVGRTGTRARYDEHRLHRDALVKEIGRLGGTPLVSEATYRLPGPVDPGGAAATAVLVERAVVEAYHEAVGRLRDKTALTLCVAHFVGEARHLTLARLATTTALGVSATDAFVTGR